MRAHHPSGPFTFMADRTTIDHLHKTQLCPELAVKHAKWQVAYAGQWRKYQVRFQFQAANFQHIG
jgi:hypothetical protein